MLDQMNFRNVNNIEQTNIIAPINSSNQLE